MFNKSDEKGTGTEKYDCVVSAKSGRGRSGDLKKMIFESIQQGYKTDSKENFCHQRAGILNLFKTALASWWSACVDKISNEQSGCRCSC